MYDNFKDSGNNYIYSNGENKYTKPAKKQKGKGAILVIMAIVFSLIGGVIGSMLTSMKMGKPNSTSPNNNITISAQDDMTIASAVAKSLCHRLLE